MLIHVNTIKDTFIYHLPFFWTQNMITLRLTAFFALIFLLHLTFTLIIHFIVRCLLNFLGVSQLFFKGYPIFLNYLRSVFCESHEIFPGCLLIAFPFNFKLYIIFKSINLFNSVAQDFFNFKFPTIIFILVIRFFSINIIFIFLI